MVRRDGRDAAPVVEPRGDQVGIGLGGQIGRSLDAHRCAQHMTGGGDRPGEVFRRRFRCFRHSRARLRPEILHDDFLDMPVLALEIGDGEQRVEPFRARLSDADQDTGGKRYRQFAGLPERRQPLLRTLVGRAEMRTAAPGEPRRQAFEHQPLRHRNLAQGRDVLPGQHARVDVGQKSRLLEDQPCGMDQIFDRGFEAERGKRLARRPVAELRLVAEGEERLLATGVPPRFGDRQHLFGRQVGGDAPAWGRGEGAVVANVAAQPRQRDEDLARIGDGMAEPGHPAVFPPPSPVPRTAPIAARNGGLRGSPRVRPRSSASPPPSPSASPCRSCATAPAAFRSPAPAVPAACTWRCPGRAARRRGRPASPPSRYG